MSALAISQTQLFDHTYDMFYQVRWGSTGLQSKFYSMNATFVAVEPGSRKRAILFLVDWFIAVDPHKLFTIMRWGLGPPCLC